MERQFRGGRVLLLRLESIDHALQSHRQQFFHHGFDQHAAPPSSKYKAPRMLSRDRGGVGGSIGSGGCRSSEIFRIDSMLLKRHAPVISARWVAASRRSLEYFLA